MALFGELFQGENWEAKDILLVKIHNEQCLTPSLGKSKNHKVDRKLPLLQGNYNLNSYG